ncbi:MAG: hypothetical protein WBM90_12815 [Acidimicrobiia bacterium]
MKIRSRLLRSFDPSLRANQILFALLLVAAVAGAVQALQEDSIAPLLAPIYLFGLWTLVREIDPDHNWTALVAGTGAAMWVLLGFDATAWAAAFGMMLAARLVVNSTGRRPYLTDLIFVGVLAVVISNSVIGWVAGFGIAIAIYVDDRMSELHETHSVVMAALVALGASVVASAAQVFPRAVPEVHPFVVIAVGLLAMIAIVREPMAPLSLVDSRLKTRILRERVHATRSLVGVLLFAAALFAGQAAEAVLPMAIGLALALMSDLIERIRISRL